MVGKDKKRNKGRLHSGFTMMEMLLVVAIIVILAIAAFAALASNKKSLDQTEWDSKAEIIYHAAQSRMLELRSAGYASLFAKGANGVQVLEFSGAGELELCYVTSASKEDPTSAAGAILPQGSVDYEIWAHNWIIEFEPVSGTVYAVFYSEGALNDNYSLLNGLREREARKKANAIGYYGGDAATASETKTLRPSISGINGEKLYAVLLCTVPEDMEGGLVFTMSVRDEAGHTTIKEVSTASGDIKLTEIGVYRYEWVLDALDNDKNYHTQFPEHTPGSNITVSFIAKADDAMVDAAKSGEWVTNSLFAYDTGEKKGTAVITAGRHLQNLDKTTSGIEGITDAIQKADLSFSATASDNKWAQAYPGKKFIPIENAELKTYTGSFSLALKDGATEKLYTAIRGLDIDASAVGGDAGLFKSFRGEKLKDIQICGAKIKASGDVGGIAGSIGAAGSETQLVNCRVYLEQQDITGAEAAENAEMPTAWMQGRNVGGLVGNAAGVLKITDSFAASVLEASARGGGLVGSATAEVEAASSYADCYISGDYTGGLMGGGNLRMQNCYAAGYQKAVSGAAGFVYGAITSANSVYTACAYTKNCTENIKPASETESHISQSYYINSFIADETSESQVEGVSFAEFSDKTKTRGKLSSAFAHDGSGDNTHPYNLLHQGLSAYSFPRLAAHEHYGDWSTRFISGTLAYYEVYKLPDNTISYGFSTLNFSSLRNELPVIGDGYGMVFDKNAEELTHPQIEATLYPSAAAETGTTITIPISGSSARVVPVGDNDAYRLVMLPADAIAEHETPTEYYRKIIVTSDEAQKAYYFNPHFANTVVEPTLDAGGSETLPQPATIIIRTARHLYNLSLHYESYAAAVQDRFFRQELDLDYTLYDWDMDWDTATKLTKETQAPIGGQSGFRATYNGGYHTITGVSIASSDMSIGLFGINWGTISNVFFTGDYVEARKEYPRSISYEGSLQGNMRSLSLGGLVGTNYGSISNCAVSGLNIRLYAYSGSSAAVGGLAGVNQASIRNCQAGIPLMQLNATSSRLTAGGFVGENNAAISLCYAITDIENNNSGINNTSLIGGFVGENRGSNSQCYCTATVRISGTAQVNGFGPNTGSNSDCHYLNEGIFTYHSKLRTYNLQSVAGSGEKDEDLVKIWGEMHAAVTYNAYDTKVETSAYYPNFDPNPNPRVSPYPSPAPYRYPYPAVLQNASGQSIHFGDWPVKAKLGAHGVFYWEREEGGSNPGTNYSYIGETDNGQSSGSTLCVSHTDGGVIRSYGYGYYYSTQNNTPGGAQNGTHKVSILAEDFNLGAENTAISAEMAKYLPGYTFRAYTTGDGEDKLRLKTGVIKASSIWDLQYDDVTVAKYDICPYFANSMSKIKPEDIPNPGGETTPTQPGTGGTIPTTPLPGGGGTVPTNPNAGGTAAQTAIPSELGTEAKPFEIRSIEQLQYINRNARTNTCTEVVHDETNAGNDIKERNRSFPYLSFYDVHNARTALNSSGFYWVQSHDLDAKGGAFTPLGSLYDRTMDWRIATEVIMAVFEGGFDGRDYTIKNVNISSGAQAIGLFGVTLGARLKNIVMYADMETPCVIEAAPQGRNWYSMGGLAGFAANGNKADSSFSNCSVSGYLIRDRRNADSAGVDGGANIGGLVGATNMDLSRCSAVTTIELLFEYTQSYNNVRVGGLAGGCRSTVSRCYSGGEIICDREIANHNPKNHTSVWSGGIFGGIYMRTGGNLGDLIGSVNRQAKAEYCYSYTKLPASGGNRIVRSPQSIASNGELQSSDFSLNNLLNTAVVIEECFCLAPYAAESWDYKHFKNRTDWSGTINLCDTSNNGNNPALRAINITNSRSPYLSYADLMGLPLNGFGRVTTMENGAPVNGIYSYNGNDPALNGQNYPFPTILTQKKGETATVNVHYGRWPKFGLFWNDTSTLMELQATQEGQPATMVMELSVENTEELSENPAIRFSYTYYDAQGEHTVDDLTAGAYHEGLPAFVTRADWDAALKKWSMTIEARTAGIVSIKVTADGVESTSLEVTVVDGIRILATPSAIENALVGDTQVVQLTLAGLDAGGTAPTDLRWTVESVDNVGVVRYPLVDAEGKLTLEFEGPGIAHLAIRCTFTYNGQTHTNTTPFQLMVSVHKRPYVGLYAANKAYRCEVKAEPGSYLGAEAGYTGAKPSELFLFCDAEQPGPSLSEFTLQSATIIKDDTSYAVYPASSHDGAAKFALVCEAIQDNCMPLRIKTNVSGEARLHLTLKRGDSLYNFENIPITLSPTMLIVSYWDENGVLRGQEEVLYGGYPAQGEIILQKIIESDGFVVSRAWVDVSGAGIRYGVDPLYENVTFRATLTTP